MERLTPADEAEAAAMVRDAAEHGKTLEIASAGTKREIGRPVIADAILEMRGLSGVVAWQPEELVLTVKAGTTLAEVDALLSARNQRFGFEPPDFGPLFGAPAARQTLAGIVAADVCGPRRVRHGSVRNHLIGCRFVNGAGEIIAAGGRVIKNVTGFDIPKLMCGAFGTLGVLTELSFRLFPLPACADTLILRDCPPDVALQALRSAAALPVEPSGLAYLPGPALLRLDRGQLGSRGQAYIRVEGTPVVVSEKLDYLKRQFRDADCAFAGPDATPSIFGMIGRGELFGADSDLWRLCVPPSAALEAINEARAALWCVDWGGGLIWLQLPASVETAQTLRRVTNRLSGHATLFRAPAPVRRMVSVFEPQSPVHARLTRDLKHAFDPGSLLNPGRMYDNL